jgi:uncharacterized repeat protein (TIGR02543 family)
LDYLINYVLNEGVLPSNVRTSFNATNLPYALPTPTRSGYAFNGWFENSSLTGTAVTSVPTNTTTNKTYHAKWTLVTHTITYNLNSGTQQAGAPTSFNATQLPLTLPTPTRAGFKFQGWYESSNFTGKPVTQIPVGTLTNKVYFAKWDETYISINYVYLKNLEYNSNLLKYSLSLSELPYKLPVLKDNLNYFIGWFSNDKFAINEVDIEKNRVTQLESTSNKNLILYSLWSVKSQHTISSIFNNLNSRTWINKTYKKTDKYDMQMITTSASPKQDVDRTYKNIKSAKLVFYNNNLSIQKELLLFNWQQFYDSSILSNSGLDFSSWPSGEYVLEYIILTDYFGVTPHILPENYEFLKNIKLTIID